MNKRKKSFFRPVLLCLVFIILYHFVSAKVVFLNLLSLKSTDLLYTLKLKLGKPPLALREFVIVAVDSLSLKFLEQRFPLKRDIYASLLNTLRDKEPKVVVFDIAFPHRDKDNFEGDYLFSLSLKNSRNIVLPSFFDSHQRYIAPHSLFRNNASGIGHLNKIRDLDFKVRKTTPLVLYRGDDFLPGKESYSLELETIKYYLGIDKTQVTFHQGESIELKKKGLFLKVPLAKDNSMTINFMADTLQFKVIPLVRILKGIVPKDVFYKKIVLIGVVEEIFHDMYPTPVGILPGIIINANSMLTVISDSFIKTVPVYVNFILLISIGILTALLILKFNIVIGLVITILEIICLFLGSYFLLSSHNLLWEFFHVVFALSVLFLLITVYKYIMLKLEKIYFEKLSITDGLTGLYIHRYFRLRLNDEFERALRHNHPFSFLIMDIDHFKSFNDTYGHEIGNEVLKMFAQVMRQNFRKVDFLARYGGEEFCAILPLIGSEGAFESAERFRKTLANTPVPRLKEVKVTVSMGISSVPEMEGIKVIDDVIKCADKALYISKENGRNQTTIYKAE